MGILWASNSQAPQRDLAHGCRDPGLNQTALLWFRRLRVWLGMLGVAFPQPRLRWEFGSRVPSGSICCGEVGGWRGAQPRHFIPWGMGWVKPPPDFSQRFQLFAINREQPGEQAGGRERTRRRKAGGFPVPAVYLFLPIHPSSRKTNIPLLALLFAFAC